MDTETTGLRPYHGDRLFSIILSDIQQSHYFNFQAYAGLDSEFVLLNSHLAILRDTLFARTNVTWSGHKFLFDLHMLWQEGIELKGKLHCTRALARVERNDHMTYTLDACAGRIGFKKDDAVEKYIAEHKLVEKRQGANQAYTHKLFNRVPFPIITAYGQTDGYVTACLTRHQEETCEKVSRETPVNLPPVRNIVENEQRLTRTIFRMERVGLRIDREYCVRASRFESDRAEKATEAFKQITGRPFQVSPKLFAEVFASDREHWAFTEKGNPSFASEALSAFTNPAARAILEYRDAKSKSDFYRGFLYHADSNGDVHASFNPDGTATGRFSSSDPNFQNLTSEEGDEAQEFLVRRAIIPRPGYIFIMPDYDQMEYRMMFDYACRMVGFETPLVTRIKSGVDPHQATADLVTQLGTPLTRKRAKNGNFALLYGSGDRTLAATIGGSIAEASALRKSIFAVAPEIKTFVDSVMRTAEVRGFIRNWAGRRSYCADRNFSYKMPNWLIQGGTADVNKFALNGIDEYFEPLKSRLVATIHDENPCEIHESEVATAPRRVAEIMESIFPWKYLPLTVGMEYSERSLGDKKKGFPV